ncbi:thiamine diphosphokinase [Celeribacter sp. HF31]|uniref:thiamine diphosphokinase n=1 Tax=Celeribacter sp. HF31 TaxID=2721558 RepID=UPI001431F877|nr:thiamine diphosphokinase [Celeribacter sp. HF31]NIY80209.1 thiamine diphosphokinase [Celeribacter sp. HF31]
MKNIEPVLITEKNVTLLGGGTICGTLLKETLVHAPCLVAADGAAGQALALGHRPDRVIGDFDSLTDEMRAEIPEESLIHVPEQDSTDFEKCLTRVEAPMIFGVGFTGARIDHELAVYATLTRFPNKRCVILGAEDVCFMAPPDLMLPTEPGLRVSLFPMARVAGRSEGLRWPIEGLDFAPDRRVGTSNEAVATEVRLEFDQPGMMVILPRESCDGELVARLIAAPKWSL